MSVIEVFWENVHWHAKNKKIKMSDLMNGNTKAANKGKANVTLKKVQEIADALDIDDYAILFEQMEEEKWTN